MDDKRVKREYFQYFERKKEMRNKKDKEETIN
jgi:hypothetical protein